MYYIVYHVYLACLSDIYFRLSVVTRDPNPDPHHHRSITTRITVILAALFALGSGVSERAADYVVQRIWPFMPLLSPMDPVFDWHTDAVRPQVKTDQRTNRPM